MNWTKEDFNDYLREELDWTRWALRPILHNLVDPVFEVPESQMLFGNLRYLGHNEGLEYEYPENLVTFPEELIEPNVTDSGLPQGCTITKDFFQNPYGILNAERFVPSGGLKYLRAYIDLGLGPGDYVLGCHFKGAGSGVSFGTVDLGASDEYTQFSINCNYEEKQGTTFKVEDVGNGWFWTQLKVSGSIDKIGFEFGDEMAAFGLSVRESTEFASYRLANIPKPRVANFTRVDGITLTLDEKQIVARKIEDSTGKAVFKGWKAIREA